MTAGRQLRPGHQPRVFRKTVATRLDEAGLSARAIADHLGHAQPSLTQDVYTGRRVATSQAAEALDRVIHNLVVSGRTTTKRLVRRL